MSQEVARLRSALMRVTAALTLDGAQEIARQALGSQSTKKISKRGTTPVAVIFDEVGRMTTDAQ